MTIVVWLFVGPLLCFRLIFDDHFSRRGFITTHSLQWSFSLWGFVLSCFGREILGICNTDFDRPFLSLECQECQKMLKKSQNASVLLTRCFHTCIVALPPGDRPHLILKPLCSSAVHIINVEGVPKNALLFRVNNFATVNVERHVICHKFRYFA